MKFASTPAWTALPRREAKADRSSPGPGAYSPSPSKAAPSYSLGTSGRLDWAKSLNTPGPGAYDPLEKRHSVGPSMSKSTRDLNMSSPNLGPGAYDIPSLGVEGPAFSIRPRTPSKTTEDGPGPGAYNTDGYRRVKARSPSAVINTTSQRSIDLREESPGPGAYSPKMGQGIGTVIGRDQRRPLSANTNPAPGTYSHVSKPEGPHYTFGAKGCDMESSSAPGPGQYDVSNFVKTKAKEPSVHLGSARRSDPPRREESPGPGAYHVSASSTGPKWTLGTKPHDDLNSTTPAPGAYEVPSTLSKTAFSMGKRTEEAKDNSSVPGPGSYLKMELRASSPCFQISKSPRTTPLRREGSPGPGAYNPKLQSAPSASFGKERRMSLPGPENTPGPGAYRTRDWITGPKFSIQGRGERDPTDKTPGPGQYDLSGYTKVRDKSPSAVMTREMRSPSRHSKSISEIPGPGNYESLKSSHAPKWAFTKDERLKNPASDTPAPGSYNVTVPVGKGGYTMGGRDERSSGDLVPGPGTYNPKLRDSSPTFKMTSSPRREHIVDHKIPGPGSYNPICVRSSAGFSFSGARRDSPSFGGETPGPGAYSANQDTHGPRYSMVSRSEMDLNRSVPGPGHYDQSHYDKVRPRSRGAVMGSESRSKAGKSEVLPGPGQYHTPQKTGGPGWRFGTDQRDKRLNESFPSPGAYEIPDTKSKLGYTMSSRHLEMKEAGGPGPGAYDARIKKAAPAYSMGGPRTPLSTALTTSPGPCKYTPVLKSSSPNVKFGSAGRSETTMSSTPGPGAYEYHSAIGKESPGYSMRGRTSEVRDQSVPGPGKYSSMTSASASPAYPFGKQARDSAFKGDEGVGPGMYYSPLKTTNPAWSFGMDQREKHPSSDSPGPGQYSIKSSIPDVAPYAVPKH